MSSKITIYQYTNFTNYSYRFLDDSKSHESLRAICFYQLMRESKTYNPEVGIEISINAFTIPEQCGYCALTVEEMTLWLEEIKQWIDYDYKLEVMEDRYVITLTTHITLKSILVLLTLIRFTFESPFSADLKEVFVLREKGYFKDNLLIHIYQVVQNSNEVYHNHHHCFSKFEKLPLLTIAQLKERMVNYNGAVNDFFIKQSQFGSNSGLDDFVQKYLLNDKHELDISDEAVAQRVNNLYTPNFNNTYEI